LQESLPQSLAQSALWAWQQESQPLVRLALARQQPPAVGTVAVVGAVVVVVVFVECEAGAVVSEPRDA